MKQAFGMHAVDLLPTCLSGCKESRGKFQAGCKGAAEKIHGERLDHPTTVLRHDSGCGNIT